MDIKFITYNIDGLPQKLNLKDLPLVFRPAAWIYKLIKGTYEVSINDNTDTDKYITHISKCLKESKADVIGVQEDFNYHDELMSWLFNYNCGTYSGGFDISKIFSNAEWLSKFPLPRFKADGLNLIVNNNRIRINKEDIVKWNHSHGYTKNASDELAHKGFRFYSITIDDKVDLDVYILHMDADFYDDCYEDVSMDVETRGKQLTQLTNYILKRYNNGSSNPIIIMGDTNSSVVYPWDVDNILDYLVTPINNTQELYIQEAISSKFDVDRLFYINNSRSKYLVDVKECYYDYSFDDEIGRVSDHRPFVTTLTITYRE